jgi:hypothetical protein
MIFDFLKKQKEFEKKKKLTQVMIMSLEIPNAQKSIYLQALEIVDKKHIDIIYNDLIKFVEKYELKELEDISKSNFVNIAWMQKKEANAKIKEINAFNFLINNI